MSDINELVDELCALRTDKKKLEFTLNELKTAIEGVERRLMDVMDDQGVKQVRTDAASVTLTESIYPQVVDRDAYLMGLVGEVKNLIENGRPNEEIASVFNNFQFRLSVPVYREKLELNIPQEGTVPFTKRGFTVRVG